LLALAVDSGNGDVEVGVGSGSADSEICCKKRACRFSPCLVSRTSCLVFMRSNNWIKGLRAKVNRVMKHRFWWYNRPEEICDYTPSPQYELNWAIEDHERD